MASSCIKMTPISFRRESGCRIPSFGKNMMGVKKDIGTAFFGFDFLDPHTLGHLACVQLTNNNFLDQIHQLNYQLSQAITVNQTTRSLTTFSEVMLGMPAIYQGK